MASSEPPTSIPASAAILDLRPLSIGEILDRAFSITFKNIVPFTAIVLVVVGPQMLLYYLGAHGLLGVLTQQFGAIQHASTTGAPPKPIDPQSILSAEAAGTPWFGATALFAILFVPLSNAAVVSGVSRSYLGLPVRFADCYRDAYPRWLSLLILAVLWMGVAIAACAGFFFVFFILGITFAALTSLLHGAGVVVAAVVGVAVGLGALLLIAQAYLAFAFSFTAAVLEGLGPTEAFSSGFRRVFGEDQFRRSLGIAASLFGILIGFEIVGSIVGAVAMSLTHSFISVMVFSAVIGAFVYPFIFSVVAVSYYDVRIRREGFDLQLLAARLSGSTPQ